MKFHGPGSKVIFPKRGEGPRGLRGKVRHWTGFGTVKEVPKLYGVGGALGCEFCGKKKNLKGTWGNEKRGSQDLCGNPKDRNSKRGGTSVGGSSLSAFQVPGFFKARAKDAHYHPL